MSELITSSDAEAIVIGHLAANIPEPVSQAIPPVRPAEFVTVRLTGGQRTTLVSWSPQITVDSWASTAPSASGLGRRVLALVQAMERSVIAGHQVYGVEEVAGLQYLPDPDSQHHRYRFTVAAHIRGDQ